MIYRTSYSFIAPQPVRYLGIVISRMSRVDAATVALDIVPVKAAAPDMRGTETLAQQITRINQAVAIPPVGARNTVAHHRYRSGLGLLNGILVVLDLGTDDAGNLFGFQLHCLVHHTIYRMGAIPLKGGTVDFLTQTLQMALHGAVQACTVHVKPQTA